MNLQIKSLTKPPSFTVIKFHTRGASEWLKCPVWPAQPLRKVPVVKPAALKMAPSSPVRASVVVAN